THPMILSYLSPRPPIPTPFPTRRSSDLGAVLYEMLTGQNAFTYNCTEREALARVQMGAFQTPRLAMPALPQGLESIVLRAMAPRSEEHTSELQSRVDLVCRLLLEKNNRP